MNHIANSSKIYQKNSYIFFVIFSYLVFLQLKLSCSTININKSYSLNENRLLNSIYSVLTCDKYGNCNRSDLDLKLGSINLKTTIDSLDEDLLVKTIDNDYTDPFLNSKFNTFLRDSKYVCGDGFYECIYSCCEEGYCTGTNSECNDKKKSGFKVNLIPTLVIFVVLLFAYWAYFIFLGLRYATKRKAVIIDNKFQKINNDNKKNDVYNVNNTNENNFENNIEVKQNIENFNDPFNKLEVEGEAEVEENNNKFQVPHHQEYSEHEKDLDYNSNFNFQSNDFLSLLKRKLKKEGNEVEISKNPHPYDDYTSNKDFNYNNANYNMNLSMRNSKKINKLSRELENENNQMDEINTERNNKLSSKKYFETNHSSNSKLTNEHFLKDKKTTSNTEFLKSSINRVSINTNDENNSMIHMNKLNHNKLANSIKSNNSELSPSPKKEGILRMSIVETNLKDNNNIKEVEMNEFHEVKLEKENREETESQESKISKEKMETKESNEKISNDMNSFNHEIANKNNKEEVNELNEEEIANKKEENEEFAGIFKV